MFNYFTEQGWTLMFIIVTSGCLLDPNGAIYEVGGWDLVLL